MIKKKIMIRDMNRIVGLIYRYSPSKMRKQEFSRLSWLSEHLCQAQTSTEVINKLLGMVMPFFTIILEGHRKFAGEGRVKSFLTTDLKSPPVAP